MFIKEAKMKSKTGIILMLAGGAAIIFSLIIIAENIRLDSQGKKNSENVLNLSLIHI